MKIKGILFDKDGTLFDFDRFWVPVGRKAVEDVLMDLGRMDIPAEEILAAWGVKEDRTDPDGVFCKGTYDGMGEIACKILRRYGCDVSEKRIVPMLAAAHRNHTDAGELIPTHPRLPKLLASFCNCGLILGLVTTDHRSITESCLKGLGIFEQFSVVITGDSPLPPKPDPAAVFDFCKKTGLFRDEILMVGDTETDALFARNAGIKGLILAKDPKQKERMATLADGVLEDLSELSLWLE